MKVTRPNCHKFRSNELRLWLTIIAHDLGNLWRRLALPRRVEKSSLTSLRQRLVKRGRRLHRHARYYWLLLAEGHLKAAVCQYATADRSAVAFGRMKLLDVPIEKAGLQTLWHAAASDESGFGRGGSEPEPSQRKHILAGTQMGVCSQLLKGKKEIPDRMR